MTNLEKILSDRRTKKIQRDGLNLEQANLYASRGNSNFSNIIDIEESRSKLREDILPNIDIPSYAPINLDSQNGEISIGLSNLCSKGPSFIPTPISFNWLQLLKGFDRFRNVVRARVIFKNKNDNHPGITITDNQTIGLPPVSNGKSWKSPKCNIPEVEAFLSAVERDLFSNTQRKIVPDNLTIDERYALKQWRADNLFNTEGNLVMRMQDKGNRFIIVDKNTDKEKANIQIEKSSFITLETDPTEKHIQIVTKWAMKWQTKGEISEEWKNFVINNNAMPGKNSTLYKTHKTDNPVRLLTSGCNTAIENLSKLCEKVCTPLAISMKGRIKETGHLHQIIDELNQRGLPENVALVSFDIINMYPNIDNQKGLSTLKTILNSRLVKKPSTQCILEGLEICLYYNNSTFANRNLLQVNGTATGAPNSCSYSDLALQPIDDSIFNVKESSYNELSYYGRYRDDCLVLWTGTNERLNDLLNFINTLDNKLQFTMEFGGDSICFLDLKISIVGNQLVTTVYSKPTDSHIYLHGNSCHNPASISGIQKGVALRLRRICTTDEVFDKEAKLYKGYLVAREHDPIIVDKAFTDARMITRNQSRQKRTPAKNQKKFFSTKCNPRGPNVKQIIDKHLRIITHNPNLKQFFLDKPFTVAYKRESNLKDLLVRSDPYTNNLEYTVVEGGFKRCNSICDSCDKFTIETDHIKCHATGKIYKIRKNITCNTPNVIYCAQCKKCLEQGVGSTTNWKPRLRNYKSHIKYIIDYCSISQHYNHRCRHNENPFEYLQFTLIDKLDNVDNLTKEEIEDLLLKKEIFWIGSLLTQHHGMNSSHDWNRKHRCQRETFN